MVFAEHQPNITRSSEIQPRRDLHLSFAVERRLRAARFQKNRVGSKRGQTRAGRGVGARAARRAGRAQVEFVLVHAEDVRAIEEVEGFGDEVEAEAFAHAEFFRQPQVNILQRALVEGIAWLKRNAQ